MKRYCAGIVLYNPAINRLQENISKINNQVDKIVLIDNKSNNINDIKKIVSEFKNIDLIQNENNLGIAKALNQIIEYSEQRGYDWVITLDQDTVCPSNLISTYNKYIDMDNKIAIICPYMIDINVEGLNSYNNKKLPKYQWVEECITSGSLTNIRICKKLGMFDEKMFIDYVDFEYCKRIKINKFKILRINEVFIKHEVGKSKKINFFGKEKIITNHPKIRKYYYYRNRVYMYRKYKEEYNFFSYYKALIRRFFTIVLEENSIEKMQLAIKGMIDGIKIDIN